MIEKKRNSNSKKVNSRKISTINNNNNNSNNKSVIEEMVNNSSNNIINKGGRPSLFPSVESLELKIDEYFNDEKNVPFTVTGLCLFLDVSYECLLDYEKNKTKEFSETVKKAKLKIEDHVNKLAMLGQYNPTIAIFNLKNNFGWKDKQETELTGNMNITFAGLLDELKKRETK